VSVYLPKYRYNGRKSISTVEQFTIIIAAKSMNPWEVAYRKKTGKNCNFRVVNNNFNLLMFSI
jgi:hypothetical protein